MPLERRDASVNNIPQRVGLYIEEQRLAGNLPWEECSARDHWMPSTYVQTDRLYIHRNEKEKKNNLFQTVKKPK